MSIRFRADVKVDAFLSGGIDSNHIVCSPIEALNVVDGLQRYYDEPMGDASAIPTFLLCEKAGECIKVALGGDGLVV